MSFPQDVKIIDLESDEGLAAFLRGTGDAYLGGIPQRTRALKEGNLELIAGTALGPAEINGLVTTRQFAQEREEDLLKVQRVIFRIIDYTNNNLDETGSIIVEELNKITAANFTLQDFKKYWNNYEHYTANASEAEKMILNPDSPTYWKRRWDDANIYFVELSKFLPKPVDPEDAFWMENAQRSYVRKYGLSAENK